MLKYARAQNLATPINLLESSKFARSSTLGRVARLSTRFYSTESQCWYVYSYFLNFCRSKLMIESSQGGAEAVPSEY